MSRHSSMFVIGEIEPNCCKSLVRFILVHPLVYPYLPPLTPIYELFKESMLALNSKYMSNIFFCATFCTNLCLFSLKSISLMYISSNQRICEGLFILLFPPIQVFRVLSESFISNKVRTYMKHQRKKCLKQAGAEPCQAQSS